MKASPYSLETGLFSGHPTVAVTGPCSEVRLAARQLLAGQTASGVLDFSGNRGSQGAWFILLGTCEDKEFGLCPLWPVEVDQHDWSRSETSLQGKKSRAGWEQQY